MYQYEGQLINELISSYEGDEEPFLQENDIKFSEKRYELEELNLLKKTLFPRYWNLGEITLREKKDKLKKTINKLGDLFYRGIEPYEDKNISRIVDKTLEKLPRVRELLKKDVEAAYKGDPAAKSYKEVIRSYPGIMAMEIYRAAHELYRYGAEEHARELSEYIHSKTGIDIHPGAEIGEYFFIDHGTGVVIGETSVIGKWVRIYQDVTLGVLHFEKEEEGERGKILKKGYERHPNIGDHVVIGSGAKILGNVDIGDHVNIGANSWVMEDIPSHHTVFSQQPELEKRSKEEKRN